MKRIVFCSIALLICFPAFAQQPDVNRFTLFTGFDYMVRPVLLGALGKPVPSAHLTDTTYFIGAGGGFDLNLSRGVGFRFAADWVNTHLFSNLLTNRQNYVRLSMGPTFRWGTLETR
jgi:hypothetical protein